MPLGELFLSAFVQVLFQQLASGAVKALASREKVGKHFEKLRQYLEEIQAVLDDAEEKQLVDTFVKTWLENLRDLAYDLDDLLDEITTQALIQQSKGSQNTRTNRVWKFVPTCSRYTPGALVSNHRTMSKIKEITIRLEDIVKRMSGLNLSQNLGGSSRPSERVTTSLVQEAQVYGRDEDRDAIIKMLLGVGNEASKRNFNFSVIPIVGMGGIGKTTLAQLVINDRKVKQNFHRRIWVCVSEEFDVLSITRTIYEKVTDMSGQSKDLDALQVTLQEKLAKNKFLIVLDDVWNESYDKWANLCKPFQSGHSESKIIVTTRHESVASVVGFPRTAYHMKLLTDDDCLSLLVLHARGQTSFDENTELKDVGLGLAKKCKGLPLAAKTLGGILRSKETKEEWDAVLNSKIWDLPKENNILPVLRLSFNHLPSHLKRLFSYCSIFPKDYEFERNELVFLWMGEGFLEKPNVVRKEALGHEYFNELLSRSFFQRISGSESLFLMHDLINDLAQSVAGRTCYRLDDKMDTNLEYQISVKARHGSFLRHEYEVLRKFKAFYKVEGLRTFLPMPVQNSIVWPPFYLSNKILEELVPELRRLRVLSLSGYSIKELPSSVCNLIHLRYLNLSGTSIITLPDTLGDLFRLQTLSLRNCRSICKLPSTIGNLSNLRHLDNSNTDQLKDLPVEMSKLKDLETLPKIVLSKGGGFGLKDLRALKILRGSLAILELQNVMDIEDVKACLDRHEIDELQLTWGSGFDNSQNICPCDEVIDLLQPHVKLSSLKIEFYRGLNFPSWIADRSYCKLSSISIINCLGCTTLPPLGQVPELKHLLIVGMPKVKCVGTEFYGNGAVDPFLKLETLRFDDMPEWEKWSAPGDGEDTQIMFPHLRRLTMCKCSKLTDVSPMYFPGLQGLDLKECSNVLVESFCNLASLSSLKVEAITGLSHLPLGLTQSLSALEVLECCACTELLSLWPKDAPLEHLVQLRRLVIADCSLLIALGQEEQLLPCKLEVLELFGCANVVSLPNDLSNLKLLRELIIKNCVKFSSFPVNGIPPTLKRLEILSCHALEALPSDLSNLERLEIKSCSSLKTWVTGGFPVAIKKLSIEKCTQLDPVSEVQIAQNGNVLLEDLSICNWPKFSNLLKQFDGFSCLVELKLSSCSKLKRFPDQGLPPALRSLLIEDCEKLRSLPRKFRTMKSLVSLELRSCPRLDNFPNCDLPTNLASLRIWDSKKFKPLKDWGLHRLTYLREFSICGGFKDLDLLGDDDGLFPPSLIKFSIARFPNLTSLCKVLEKLTMLRHLSIMNCANLNVLPSKYLLENLWHLEISDCQLLTPRCLKDKGEYWPTIAGIPCVEIDTNKVQFDLHSQNTSVD